jgi:hypothetical protein
MRGFIDKNASKSDPLCGMSVRGLQAQEQYEALHTARQRQTTAAFAQHYAPRAGIESAHAQGIRQCGLRQSRYLGLAKTHWQHSATAAALNMVRLGEWWAGTPHAKTRYALFTRLKQSLEERRLNSFQHEMEYCVRQAFHLRL